MLCRPSRRSAKRAAPGIVKDSISFYKKKPRRSASCHASSLERPRLQRKAALRALKPDIHQQSSYLIAMQHSKEIHETHETILSPLPAFIVVGSGVREQQGLELHIAATPPEV